MQFIKLLWLSIREEKSLLETKKKKNTWLYIYQFWEGKMITYISLEKVIIQKRVIKKSGFIIDHQLILRSYIVYDLSAIFFFLISTSQLHR